MTPARATMGAAAAAVLVLLVVGLAQLRRSSPAPASVKLSLAQVRERLRGSPAVLEALHAQAGELLGGGLPALRARLAALRGVPVVINKWASWCAPCRAEFSVFQAVSLQEGRRVAFIGLDSGDNARDAPRRFLSEHPVGYPSFYDASGQAGAAVTDSSFTPVTVFLDGRGGRYIRQGPYPSVAKLRADVERYALSG